MPTTRGFACDGTPDSRARRSTRTESSLSECAPRSARWLADRRRRGRKRAGLPSKGSGSRNTLPRAVAQAETGQGVSTDGVGFEPTVRYERTHTFQACALNHSATRPHNLNHAYTDASALSGADRVRFELTIPLPVRRFSRPVPSTTRPPVQDRTQAAEIIGLRSARQTAECPKLSAHRERVSARPRQAASSTGGGGASSARDVSWTIGGVAPSAKDVSWPIACGSRDLQDVSWTGAGGAGALTDVSSAVAGGAGSVKDVSWAADPRCAVRRRRCSVAERSDRAPRTRCGDSERTDRAPRTRCDDSERADRARRRRCDASERCYRARERSAQAGGRHE